MGLLQWCYIGFVIMGLPFDYHLYFYSGFYRFFINNLVVLFLSLYNYGQTKIVTVPDFYLQHKLFETSLSGYRSICFSNSNVYVKSHRPKKRFLPDMEPEYYYSGGVGFYAETKSEQ